jgi:hypothetical protein
LIQKPEFTEKMEEEMKYLCLAYGAEKDWKVLTKSEQDALLAQDEAIRRQGALMAAVETTVTTVRAWDGKPTVTDGGYANMGAPLAGFSVIEAADLNRSSSSLPTRRAPARMEQSK